jgi:hypothetical protein
MTEYTRPATWEDLKSIAAHLHQAGVEYALVGGYAIAAHGFGRLTEDIDLLVNPSPDNSQRWILALANLPDGATRELLTEPDVFAQDKRYAVRINDEFTVEVMPSIAGYTWEEMTSFVEQIDLDGVPLRLLNLQGLLKTKQGARPKDQMDAANLRAAIERLDSKKGTENKQR